MQLLCRRPLACVLAIFACLFLWAASASAQPSATGPVRQLTADTYVICSDLPIPPGYAVVQITRNSGCKYAIEYTIVPAVEGLRVCSGTPIPSPFVETRIEAVGNSPCNGQTNMSTINQVRDGIYACSGSPIPGGWSYTRIASPGSECGSLYRYELHASVAGMDVCSTSPYPNTLIVSSINASSICNGLKTYRLATPYNGVQACSVGNMPANYVVPRADVTSSCGLYYAWTLVQPYDGVVVCPFSPIPEHYYKGSPVAVTNCESYNSGYRLVYIP